LTTLAQITLLLENLRSYFSPKKTIMKEHEASFKIFGKKNIFRNRKNK
jgi:hypothetical protein